MNKKQQKTLERIFEDPVRSNIKWVDVVSLLESLGADVKGGHGSVVVITLEGSRFVCHKPHPSPDVKKLRRFLGEAGVS